MGAAALPAFARLACEPNFQPQPRCELSGAIYKPKEGPFSKGAAHVPDLSELRQPLPQRRTVGLLLLTGSRCAHRGGGHAFGLLLAFVKR